VHEIITSNVCLWACFCQNWRLLFHNGHLVYTLKSDITKQLCRIWRGVGILGGKYYENKCCSQFGQFNNAFIFFVIERIIYYPRNNVNKTWALLQTNTNNENKTWASNTGGKDELIKYFLSICVSILCFPRVVNDPFYDKKYKCVVKLTELRTTFVLVILTPEYSDTPSNPT
jgi:hypothetical protein